MYTIIDIETTGGSSFRDKITEIAAYKHDGEKIIDKFVTLINPERPIPNHITRLTGISDEMVANAPKFYEIAKELVEFTENSIFVAHNVNFDYNFIRVEFKNLGYQFKRRKLCTVQLSRKLIPGKKSYSLGNLCKDIGIEIQSRHRAEGDVKATAKLFDMLLAEQNRNTLFSQVLTPTSISAGLQEQIENLPEETGVYYFYNNKNDLIYVGKSTNIYNRVLSHFHNNSTRKALNMKEDIAQIDHEITGSELVALLLESEQIKLNKPLYNRSQRRAIYANEIVTFTNNEGYTCFNISKDEDPDDIIISFSTKKEAMNFMHSMVEKYQLCQKLCGLYQNNESCFQYHVNKCKGACIGQEAPETYNSRAQLFMNDYTFPETDMLIVQPGRSTTESAIVRVKNGKYYGFGYVENDDVNHDIETLVHAVKRYQSNRDSNMIVRNFLRRNPTCKTIMLPKFREEVL